MELDGALFSAQSLLGHCDSIREVIHFGITLEERKILGFRFKGMDSCMRGSFCSKEREESDVCTHIDDR